MTSTIRTTRPKETPVGYRRFKYCTGKYKAGILGKTVESDMPVWAERRVDPNPMFAEDKVYYVLYTFVPFNGEWFKKLI
jgi:hypothetical protein